MKKIITTILIAFFFLFSHANIITPTKGGDNGVILTGLVTGDTVVIQASQNPWSYIYVGTSNGNLSTPIVVINDGTVVMTAGISLENDGYVKATGRGSGGTVYSINWLGLTYSKTCGFSFTTTYGASTSNAIGISGLSHDIEVENVYVNGDGYTVWAKNEIGDYQANADKGAQYWWPHRMYNINIHDLIGINIFQDWGYLGTTDPYGNARSIAFDGSSSTITIPTSHPSVVTITVPTGKGYYVPGTFIQVYNGSNFFTATITSYNSGTGSLVLSSVANTGTGTFNSWGINAFPRPTGLAGVQLHDCILYRVGRSGIQWGNVDSLITGSPNKIYNNRIFETGLELNDQQGMAIAVGSASNTLEVYNNFTDSNFKNGIFSYNFGTINIHDNSLNNTGHITMDSTTTNPNLGFLIRLDKSINGVTYSSSVQPQGVYVKPTSEYLFVKFVLSALDVLPTWVVFRLTPTPTQSPREVFIQYFTTAIGSHTGSSSDPYVGWGGSGTVTNAAITLPVDGRLPYNMNGIFFNIFNAQNISVYGDPAGRTSFLIKNNTITHPTETVEAFAFLANNNTYDSTLSRICENNILNGTRITSSNIFVDPSATSFGYSEIGCDNPAYKKYIRIKLGSKPNPH